MKYFLLLPLLMGRENLEDYNAFHRHAFNRLLSRAPCGTSHAQDPKRPGGLEVIEAIETMKAIA